MGNHGHQQRDAGVQSEHLTLHKRTFLGGGVGSLQRLLNFQCNPKRAICCIQLNLSTIATLGTEESGRCGEVAVMGR